MRRAAVVERRADHGKVEAAVRIAQRLGVLEVGGILRREVRERDVTEAVRREHAPVEIAARDDEHSHLATHEPLLEQLPDDPLVEVLPLHQPSSRTYVQAARSPSERVAASRTA